MSWLTLGVKAIPWILDVVAIAIAAFLFFQLQSANRRLGALEVSNDALVSANAGKSTATRDRAVIERRNRTLGPDAVIDKLR